MSYSYDPETDTILLELHGGFDGLFGISITPMSEGSEMGFNSIKELLDTARISINLYQFLDENTTGVRNTEQEIQLDKIARDVISDLFTECFDEAGGKQSQINFYFRLHQADDVFDLKSKDWISIYDLYE